MRVLAAIVTHNRSQLLSRCIDHIQSQTRPPDALVVINNGSTDNTLLMLAQLQVDVITQANLGSAGGWHRAIAHCVEEGFDAVWLMDDDGFPAPDSLEQLELALEPGVACASSVVVQEHRPDHFVFPFPLLDSAGLPVILARPRKLPTLASLEPYSQKGTYPFAHLFNGALVAASAIHLIGNVNSDFFIFGDEVDYFFRLRRVGKVFSLIAARHLHPDVSSRPYSSIKIYYYIRNTLILNTRYFNQVWLRHGMAVVAGLWRTARRNGALEALSYVAGSRLPVLLQAVHAGLNGRLGREFHG
jgi:rhamnopyranosyl-N-acetylglucosaminyl-diphospho-decaprenol beta-1,3/1,4-galactofuranosyltransferase